MGLASREGQSSNPEAAGARDCCTLKHNVTPSSAEQPWAASDGPPPPKHTTAHQTRSTASLTLSDLVEVHGIVLGKLPGESLASVACCSRQMRELVEESATGGERWRALAEAELGPSTAALHARHQTRPSDPSPPVSAAAVAPQCSGSRASGLALATPHRVDTRFWRHLHRCVFTGESLHWDRSAASQLWSQVRTHSSDESEAQVPANQAQLTSSRSPLSQLLARSGHTATMLDDLGLLVIIGGLMNDSDATPETTVLVIRFPSLGIVAPVVTGPHGSPPSRYRHAAVSVPVSMHASCLKYFRGEELEDGGALLAVHGGYDSASIYGGRELLLLWVSKDGDRVRWAAVTTGGSPPPPCFHHTLVALRQSPGLVMVGGECSHEQANQPPDNPHLAVMPDNAVFTLWLPTMAWNMQQTTFEPSCGINPGQRWLHACTMRPKDDTSSSPDEELVVVGGITPDGVDDMVPYVLNLGTYKWRMPHHSQVFKHNRPPGRHRFASAVTGRFLVVNGGCDRGQWLDDTAMLDLHLLSWRPPPKIWSEPLRHQAVAGHTLAGLIAFGGCERGFFGISPVAKMDVLMFGDGKAGSAACPGAQKAASGQLVQSLQRDIGDAAAVMQIFPSGSEQGVQSVATCQADATAAPMPAPIASMYDSLFNAFAAGGATYVMIGPNGSNTSSGEGSFDASEWADSDASDAGNGSVQPHDEAANVPPGKGAGSGPSGSGGSGSGEATDTLQQDSGSCDELPNSSESSGQNQQ